MDHLYGCVCQHTHTVQYTDYCYQYENIAYTVLSLFYYHLKNLTKFGICLHSILILIIIEIMIYP